MKKSTSTAVYDAVLKVEAYYLKEASQPFPNHFHDHYVIGLVESGRRILSCKNKIRAIEKGNIILFNPGDSHACMQSGDDPFVFLGFNIPKSVILKLSGYADKTQTPPAFSKNVISSDEIACYLRSLHEMIMLRTADLKKEDRMLKLISALRRYCGNSFYTLAIEYRLELKKACDFIKNHLNERIDLDQICRHSGLSKSTLLRVFTKTKGITPYRYLEIVRVNAAKELLKQGMKPIEAALQTGFSDQSHFTNCFNSFIGLTPGAYREIFFEKHGIVRQHHE